jgi:MoxR-like ATPase
MPAQFYTGRPSAVRPSAPVDDFITYWRKTNDPSGYIADAGLVDAVNVALVLGQPLLLTGEPGTGKTQFAHSLAWELGFRPPLIFETKSTSTARDLFYTYDTVGRFHSAQTGDGSQNSVDYLTYNALGAAILRANDEGDVAPWLPQGFVHGGRQRSVVLIDEIDKAPRDFPNDILNEVEEMFFKVPELKNIRFAADSDMRPILILTSNSEKHLPDAFLRRCVYYNIPFPDRDRLMEIIASRIHGFGNGDGTVSDIGEVMMEDALDYFAELRQPATGLHKRPATAELLGWLAFLLEAGAEIDKPLLRQRKVVQSSLSALVKGAADQSVAATMLDTWMAKHGA